MTDVPQRDSLPYRDCVGIVVFNSRGEVFIGRRKPEDDPEDTSEMGAPWQLPQGGIDEGEAPYDAAVRELYEETGIKSVTLLAEVPGWIYYDLPDELLGIALKGKYRGQRQRWFALAFTGDESEIDIDTPGGGEHKPEFDAWRWERLELMPEIVVSFKQGAYREVAAAFEAIARRMAEGSSSAP